MREKLNRIYWDWRFRMLEGFIGDEEGDSNMVAVVVLIVIVLAAAVIFREGLMEAVTNVMDKFTEFVG